MDLKKEIENIKIIDDHQHGMDPFYWQDALGQAPPFPPEIHGLEIPSCSMHLGRKRKLLAMYKKLYGFSHTEMTAENTKELQAMYDKSKNDEASIYHKVMDLAGIETALEVCLSRPILPPGLNEKRFKRVALIDGFLIPFNNSEIKNIHMKAGLFVTMAEAFAKNIKNDLNWHPETFDDYLKFLSTVIRKLREQGCVALKSSSGYWRGLNFEIVSEEEARGIFESKNVKHGPYKRLQDYLLKYILIEAGKIGLPFQMHSGSGGVEGFARENDPSLFDRMLWDMDIKETKVIILHGGFPYCREAGFMVAGFGRRPRPLYLDMSIMWMDHPTPNGASLLHTLRDWLEMGLAPKLIYGSDATSPFRLWMSAINIREDLYTVLKAMVDDGLVGDEQALSMAEQILRGNAETVYGL